MTQSKTKTDFNQMSDKELVTDYWTKRAPAFKKQRQAELKSEKMLQWQTEICSRLPQKSGLTILDIGCGAGFFSILLAEKGHNVTGIDLTESMIEEARKLGQETGSAASFLVMDAERLTFADNVFDAVVSRNVTWNLPHPEQAYAEWLRVLKPGGMLL
ncbi:MAG: class I SAM-dependent methyltransferase, partial [Acidaminococcaceae bacterium]|nr:class I SAM-dependent methyltransferase [Acidaminococcaceae bacterium]